MSLALALVVAVDGTSGPFPPTYPAGASGFVAAGSNPSGSSAGTLTPALYYGSAILAVANDAAGGAATQLCVALAGTFDATFLGNVTTPDNFVYPASAATCVNSVVSGAAVTTWTWPLQVGAVALVSGQVVFGNTNDLLIALTGDAEQPTQINLSWTNYGPTPPASYSLYRGVSGAAATLYQSLSGTTTTYSDTGLTSGTQYNYAVAANYSDGTAIASGAAISGTGGNYAPTLGLGFNSSGGFGGETMDGGYTLDPPCGGSSGTISSPNLPDGSQLVALYTHSQAGNHKIVIGISGIHPQSYFSSVTYVGGSLNPLGATSFSTSSFPGYSVWTWNPPQVALPAGVITFANVSTLTYETQEFFTPSTPGLSDTFNCDCESQPLPEDGWMVDTLGNLRERVAMRCGYAAQASNLPAGMVALINEFLRTAQNQLYRQHVEFRGKRLYAWQMEPNVRYYNLSNDESDCRRLDPYSVEWCGFEDLNQAWYPLINGIDPVLYTRAQISTGWPTHYEIRSCIEIFPAPRAAYTLWIKGRFGIDPFKLDTDTTTVDAEAVYLLASGLMKIHYGQVDGQALLNQAMNYTKYLVAGSHGTRRYVPRTRVQTPMTPPRFLPLES